jgi:uncharacterized protein YkwD
VKKRLFRCAFVAGFLIPAAALGESVSATFGESSFADIKGLDAIEQAMFNEVNRVREDMGLDALVWDERLTSAARQHSDEMERLYYFAHESPTAAFADLSDRVYLAGLTDISVAENLASENNIPLSADPEVVGREVTKLLMASEHHRANILDRRFTHSGIGCVASAEGTLLCTQLFSKRMIEFKSLEIKEETTKTLKISLTLRTDDVIGVWLDEINTYVFEPRDGIVTVNLMLRASEGPRKVVLARRGVNEYGAMKGFFMGKVDPKKPINISAGITDVEVISEEQTTGENPYYVLEAEGELLTDADSVKLADGNVRSSADLKGKKFKAEYVMPAGTGLHEIYFLVGEETAHAVKVDTDRPVAEAFGLDLGAETGS